MVEEPLQRLLEARHHDPFAVLGRHPDGHDTTVVRAFCPGVSSLSVEGVSDELPMKRLGHTDLFQWNGPSDALPKRYRLIADDGRGHTWRFFDPYAFEPVISEFDLHLFGEGRHRNAYRFMGAHRLSIDGIDGVTFTVWAPNAERVSVVGDFNRWDGRAHPMRSRGGGGVWELFIPGLGPGALYKFELRSRHDGQVHLKTDPYGRHFQYRPDTAAIVTAPDAYDWGDQRWMAERAERNWLHAPMSIYEVHLGSWQREDDGNFLGYRELAHRLVDYVREAGFTHIELLPITEHPFDGSWGYQTTGYFAPTSRFGEPDDLRYLIDLCHRNDIGVLLDWVPAHFPKDAFALARFDGTPLYEHADPRRGEHRDWDTYIFDYGRNEVRSFLISSADYWFEAFHFDGLRVDAVASMLYLDYSRQPGDWMPNVYGGRENLDAISFLRELNQMVHSDHPGGLVIAEESTSWPSVSRPIENGGLGFSMKWNMGWMNDTLEYIHREPVHRRFHHNQLTFGLLYAFSENFVLPFSHDEVVHMKRSMLEKMPGDEWQRFANLRVLYSYMWTMPGKKLLFMGGEFAQSREWNHETALEWHLLQYTGHAGVQRLVADLNRLYRELPALHRRDFDPAGFQWLDCDNADESLLSYVRRGDGDQVVVLVNFTPVVREGVRLGLPEAGGWEVIFNSDSQWYGGSNRGPGGTLHTEAIAAMGQSSSVTVDTPPLGCIIMRHKR